MKILIVDDSRAMQTIVRRGIEKLGYDDIEIRSASNGFEALDIIRVWEPRLMLCDWHMPEMSGLELLHALNREMLSVQTGFVTTETSEERKQEAFAAGAKFFVQKPFDYETLHEAVLPIFQGSIEGEKALEHHQPEKDDINNIALPDLETLTNILSQLSKIELSIKPTGKMALTESHFPCLIGLFEDLDNKTVRAVAIMDLNATCILGACVTRISEEKVHEAILQKAVPKPFIANCQKIMCAFSTALYDKELFKPLQLRSINIMRRKVSSIDKLLSKPEEERIDIQVTVENYDTGKLTLISS